MSQRKANIFQSEHMRVGQGGGKFCSGPPACFAAAQQACSSLRELAEEQGQQIDGAENDDPDAVNEVPVHFGGFDGKMLLLSEVAAHCTHENDNQKDQANRDMQAVEAGQREKGRAEDAGLGREIVAKEAGILEDLPSQENRPQDDGKEKTQSGSALVALRNGGPGDMGRKTAGEQDRCINQRKNQARV